MMKKVLLALFLLPSVALAQVVTAASCSQSAVQAALSAVTASTTTVDIPAGTCTWTGQINWTVPAGNASLSILGAGSLTVTGGGDATVIVDDDTTDSNNLLSITASSSSSAYLRIAGLSIEDGTGVYKSNGILQVDDNGGPLRIDHDHFFTSAGAPSAFEVVRLVGWPVGVADHDLFDGGSAFQFMDNTFEGDASGAGYLSWATPSNFGNANKFYVENSVFDYTGYSGQSNAYASDCWNGGRFVYRFNTFENVGVQDHATGSTGQWRGCRTVEIYENTYEGTTANPTFAAFFEDSGTAMIWGNSAPTGFENFVYLNSDRSNNNTYPESATPNGWGYCGTSFNGAGSAWDGSATTSSGYPCLDNPGRGQSDLLANWFPYAVDTVQQAAITSWSRTSNVVTINYSSWTGVAPAVGNPVYIAGATTGSAGTSIDSTSAATGGNGAWVIASVGTGSLTFDQTAANDTGASGGGASGINWPHQRLSPIYEWDNTYSPVPGYPANTTVSTPYANVFTANQDYYQYATSFTGASGTGSGTYAAMPATCTTGVAYWATDKGSWNQSGGSNPASYAGQGELYVCTATNTWGLYYTPYVYPDPLDVSASAAQLAPDTPMIAVVHDARRMPAR